MKKFMEKIKEFPGEHFGWFLAITLAIACIIGITINFACAKPMSDEQIIYCQEAAKNVYSQNGIIYEAPDKVDVTINDTSIEVGMQGVRGRVIATLKNGELVFDYTPEIGDNIFVGSLLGIVGFLFFLLVFLLTQEAKEKKRRRERKKEWIER